MPGSDKELLAAAKNGDFQALGAILERCRRQFRQSLRGKIAPCWQAVLSEDDVLQVTFIEAFLQIAGFQSDEPAAFVKWLIRIAENNLRDAIEGLEAAKRPDPRRRIFAPPGSDESFAGLLDVLAVTESTPSRHVSGAEARGLLTAAIARLPKDYATVVRMCDLEGRPAQEAAAAVNRRSLGAVYMLRSRAHHRLRELLPSASGFFSRCP